jgi:hypothetical protein
MPGIWLPGGGARFNVTVSAAGPDPTPGSVRGRGDRARGGDACGVNPCGGVGCGDRPCGGVGCGDRPCGGGEGCGERLCGGVWWR